MAVGRVLEHHAHLAGRWQEKPKPLSKCQMWLVTKRPPLFIAAQRMGVSCSVCHRRAHIGGVNGY
jgi:hypothetical protein